MLLDPLWDHLPWRANWIRFRCHTVADAVIFGWIGWIIDHPVNIAMKLLWKIISKSEYLGLSENVVYPYTQWFCWSLSLLFISFYGYFIGGIPHFQVHTHLWISQNHLRMGQIGQDSANAGKSDQKSLILGAVFIINKANHKPPPNLNCLKMVV